jgi:endoglycosylceramidase
MRSRRGVPAILAVAATIAALSGATLTAAASRPAKTHQPSRAAIATPVQPIGHAGRWLVDARGRVLLIHGINVSMKGSLAQSRAYDFGANDAAYLAANGFNAVRLTVERYDVEPSPGHFDTKYLAFVRHIVTTLNRRHVLTLIDFHQDEFGPTFRDNGYPAWMTQTGGLPNVTSVGFPFQYLANPAVNHAFDTLWSNGKDTRGVSLWTDDAQILGHTVAALERTPGLLGFEILNEPWPGTTYPSCLPFLVGCPLFDRGPFSHYYAAMDRAIRKQNATNLVFYEPLVLFNYGIPTSVVPPPGDSRLGFAFHDYPLCSAADDAGLPISLDTDCGVESALTLSNAVSYAKRHGTALLDTEFGATTNEKAITQATAAYDNAMVPWLFWSYDELVGTDQNGAFTSPPASTPNTAVVDGLVRPYPQLVAGTPLHWSYSPATHDFAAAYSTHRASGAGRFGAGAISQFEIPKVAFPNGYDATVTGGRVVSARNAPVLLIAAARGASSVAVSVTPTR